MACWHIGHRNGKLGLIYSHGPRLHALCARIKQAFRLLHSLLISSPLLQLTDQAEAPSPSHTPPLTPLNLLQDETATPPPPTHAAHPIPQLWSTQDQVHLFSHSLVLRRPSPTDKSIGGGGVIITSTNQHLIGITGN